MKIGPFYFDSREIFLLVAAILLGIFYFLGWSLPFFNIQALLVLAIIFLITKGLLPSVHNENFLILALLTILFTLYLPLFQVLLFYFISFFLLKAFRII